MTTPARVLHGTLDLLDRQLRDRDGTLCGNVDDLELIRDEDGAIYVTHIICGGGALAYRLNRKRFGRWLHRAASRLSDAENDRTMVPIVLARSIGPVIDIEVSADDLATHDLERWARTHFVAHMPLRGRDARQ